MGREFSTCKVHQIRMSKTITDYLAVAGYQSCRDYGDKEAYLCPLPDHKDKAPSFFVYKTGTYQSFYCWGCKKTGDIIELNKLMKELPSRLESLRQLSDGIDLNYEDELAYAVAQLGEEDNKQREDMISLPGKIALALAIMGNQHLEDTEYDTEEIEFLDKLYEMIDRTIWENDIKTLCEIYDFITSENVKENDGISLTPFMYRVWRFDQKKQREVLDDIKTMEVYQRIKG